MTILSSATTRPAVISEVRAPSALFRACRDGILRYFIHRAAIARLREFDDAELRDIGLTRSQIEPAVHGHLARLPDWPRR